MSIKTPTETTPLKGGDDEQEKAPGNWWPFQALGKLELPGMNKYRHELLTFCLVACSMGCFMALAAILGAFVSGPPLRGLFWMLMEGHGKLDGMTMYVGVKHVCMDGPSGFKCADMSAKECHKDVATKAFCDDCKGHALSLTIPLIIGTITFIKLVYGSYHRYEGNDSNIEKFGCSVAAVLGGASCLYSLVGYSQSCLMVAEYDMAQVSAFPGPGYILMVIAMCIKTFAGTVHLLLPVARSKSEITKAV